MSEEKDRRIMQLATQILNWDKVDCNQILPVINEFEDLLKEKRYQPSSFGITKSNLPSAYIPKLLKESNKVLLVDKNKYCIYGETSPYEVKSVKSVKASLTLLNKLNKK